MKAIKIEAERAVTKQMISGVEFFVGVSPYFFPERLECAYDKTAGTYTINFRYLDREPADEIPQTQDRLVEIRVGIRTKRVLSVVVHVDRNDVDRIEMLVTERIPKAIGQMKSPRADARANYRFAENAILAHHRELTNCLIY